MAILIPRRRPPVRNPITSQVSTAGAGAVPVVTRRVNQPTTTARRAPAPGARPGASRPPAPPPVTAPTPIATPALSVTPIQTPEATSGRASAIEQYVSGMSDVNRQLQELAFRYGGAPTVEQFGYAQGADPRSLGGDVTSQLGVTQNDPNSILGTISRNLQNQQKFVDQTHEADNTFFSGLRLTDQDVARSDADRQRAQAATDYRSAMANLVSQLTGARTGRNDAIRAANNADDAATAQAIAQAQAQAQATAAAAQGPALPPGLVNRTGNPGQTVEGLKNMFRRTKTVNGKTYYLGNSGTWIPMR
jgi:hypothetical protein